MHRTGLDFLIPIKLSPVRAENWRVGPPDADLYDPLIMYHFRILNPEILVCSPYFEISETENRTK